MTAHECSCGKPIRNNRTVCDDCADTYARILGDATWLDEQLEITLTGSKGSRPSSGSRSTDKKLPYNAKALDVRHYLKAALVRAARACMDLNLRGSDPNADWPEDTIAAISRWLLWRVDALALTDWMPELTVELIKVELDALRLIDRPIDAKFLGLCDEEFSGQICDGAVYAKGSNPIGKCRDCNTAYDAQRCRDRLETKLDDRLCTAAEIARLSTYLGLRAGRDRVRKTLNQWAKREPSLVRQHDAEGATMFRYGDVRGRLSAAYEERDTA